jgi:hypothetical protein
MNWRKLGYSFEFNTHKQIWQQSHAMMPVVLELDDRLRVYYTSRHIDGKSRITFYDADKNDPTKILYLHDKPVLEVGLIGTFDDCGTVATFVLRNENKIYLYYNGYNVRNTVPWSNSIGLAVSEDEGKTFSKMFNGPIMDRFKNDEYFTITPCIIKKEAGDWHMWYTSGTGWLEIENRKEPVYDLRYATSVNGIDWKREFKVAISQSRYDECVARSTILEMNNRLHMWFIYRGSNDFRGGKDSYRIGYAEGDIDNPTTWLRKDEKAGITPGPESYDNTMQSYPFVIKLAEKVFMFYNGNAFGANGILCAELEVAS